MADYRKWIKEFSDRHDGIVLGECIRATAEMLAAFPELREVRGHVHCMWGKRGHVWCVDQSGAIIDPTRTQFPGPIEYEAWKPGDEVCVGKCMNCGEEIWRGVQDLANVKTECVCSDGCDEELRREYA